MRRLSFALFLAACCGRCFADGARLVSFEGPVEMKTEAGGEWAAADAGAEIREGGAVRTEAGARALLEFPNKSKLWLKEASTIELEQQQNLANTIALLSGKIKALVPHLAGKEIFEIRTQNAVCAVRGTELVLSADEEGKLSLQVLYGEVKFTFLVPPKGGETVRSIAQGLSFDVPEAGKDGKASLLTRKDEIRALEDWSPGLGQKERTALLRQKAADRLALNDFAGQAARTEASVQNLLASVREEDFAAGRTLTDVHGNLVRVDQRLLRPTADSLQFINIVKRDSYDYSGTYAYNGNSSARLDAVQTYMTFDSDLPQNLSDWAGFFKDNDVKAEKASMIFSSQNSGDSSAYVIGYIATYDAEKDELDSNDLLYFGTVDKTGYNQLAQCLVANADGGQVNSAATGDAIGGLAWAVKNESVSTIETKAAGSLYRSDAAQYCVGGDCSGANAVWLTAEYYGINNEGKVRGTGEITDSSLDVFSLAKDSAGEIVLSVKNDSGGTVGTSDANLYVGGAHTNNGSRNIDAVILPDAALAVLENMLPVISDVK